MKRSLLTCALFLLAVSVARSGVVIEMEVRESGAGGSPPVNTIYAEDQMLRMDSREPESGSMSMVFRDQALWMMDHDKKECRTIDKAGMEQIGSQIGGMLQQMEAELAKLPPDQRAMMEKMLKENLPAGMPGPGAPRKLEIGGAETIGQYKCTLHTLYSGDEKVWDVCAAAEGLPAGAAEAMAAFEGMSEFAEPLREVFRKGPFAGMIETPFNSMKEIDGMPVRVRGYKEGQVVSESTLKSITSRDLDDAMFSVPEGYEVTNLTDEMKQSR